MRAPNGPLAGLRVAEFAQNAAAPYGGRLLAGLGAEVVKIEPPDGDAMRRLAQLGPNEAKGFAAFNPGKRGMCLDLTRAEAGEVVDALTRWADVVVVAFKQTDLERFGLDWPRLRAIDPALVYAALTPFGPEGPHADVGGYDVLVQAMSGAGFIMNRSDGSVPLPTRPAINDFATGMMTALGIVAALRHRDATGEGQRVDVSLLGTAMGLATAVLGHFPAVDDGPVAEIRADIDTARTAGVGFEGWREMYESRVLSGQGAFRLYFRHYLTADGIVSVAGLSAGLARRFHEVTGLPRPPAGVDLDHPDFAAVVEQAEALFATRTTDEWLETLRAADYPCTRYLLPYEALEEEQALVNGYLVDLHHPTFGRYRTTGMPLRFERSDTGVPGPSPTLGQHTDGVLAEIGLPPERIADLRASGTVA